MRSLPLNCFGQLIACPIIEIDHLVEVWIDALGERAESGELLAVLLQEVVPVRVGSPLRVVVDAGAVCASVQCRPDEAGLILHRVGEATPLIDQRLLLLRFRLKNVDQRHQVTFSGNKHVLPPLE